MFLKRAKTKNNTDSKEKNIKKINFQPTKIKNKNPTFKNEYFRFKQYKR